MARRRAESVVEEGQVMPDELRRPPTTAAEIRSWVGDELPPEDWGIGAAFWRRVHAHGHWSRARWEWRVEHDRSFWWWWRKRDLTPPPRAVRNEYARGVVDHGEAS